MAALCSSDLIIHAGDVGKPGVLEELRAVAPVIAVRGNIDKGPLARKLPERDVLELEGCRILILHDLADIELDPREAGFQAVIFGHSHRPLIETRDGVLHFNPGSAGPRRFRLPVTVGRLTIAGGGMTARIIELGTLQQKPASLPKRLSRAAACAAGGVQNAAARASREAR